MVGRYRSALWYISVVALAGGSMAAIGLPILIAAGIIRDSFPIVPVGLVGSLVALLGFIGLLGNHILVNTRG